MRQAGCRTRAQNARDTPRRGAGRPLPSIWFGDSRPEDSGAGGRTGRTAVRLMPVRLPAYPPSLPSFLSCLKRRAEAEGPESLYHRPLLRHGIVQSGDGKAEQVHPNRQSQGLERGSDPGGIVSRLAVPAQCARLVPDQADVVEDRALDGREPVGEEAQGGCENREPELGADYSQLGADQAVQLRAAGLGIGIVGVQAFVPAIGARRIAAKYFGVPPEDPELFRIAANSAEVQESSGEHHRADHRVVPAV